MCKEWMIDWADGSECKQCGIVYWQVSSIEAQIGIRSSNTKSEWSQIPLPVDQPYYYFIEHEKFYTVSEMERLCRLKAFL